MLTQLCSLACIFVLLYQFNATNGAVRPLNLLLHFFYCRIIECKRSLIMISYKISIFYSKKKQMTLKQIEQSVATFRKSCMQQTGVDSNSIDAVRRGEFPENDTNLKVPIILKLILP